MLSMVNFKLGNGPLAKSFEMLGNLNAPDIPFLSDLGIIESSEESHLREYVLDRMNRGDRDFERSLKVYDEAEEGKLYRRVRVLEGMKSGRTSSYDYFKFKRGMKGKLGFSNDESFLLVGANTVYCFAMITIFLINNLILRWLSYKWAKYLMGCCTIVNRFLFDSLIFDLQMVALTQIVVYPLTFNQPWRIVVSLLGSYLLLLTLIYDYVMTFSAINRVSRSQILSCSKFSDKDKKKSKKKKKRKKKKVGIFGLDEEEEDQKLIKEKKEKKKQKKGNSSKRFEQKIKSKYYINVSHKRMKKSQKLIEEKLENLLSKNDLMRFESMTEEINPYYVDKGYGYALLFQNMRYFVIQVIIAGLQNTPKLQVSFVFTIQMLFVIYLTYLLRKTKGEKHCYFKSIWDQRKFYAEEICYFSVVIIISIIGLVEDTDKLGSQFLTILEFSGLGAIFLNVAVELLSIIANFVEYLFEVGCCGRTRREILSKKKEEILEHKILKISFKKKEKHKMDKEDLEFKEFYENMVKNNLEVNDLTKEINLNLGGEDKARPLKTAKQVKKKVGKSKKENNGLRIESKIIKDHEEKEGPKAVRKETKNRREKKFKKNHVGIHKKKRNRVKKSIETKLRR